MEIRLAEEMDLEHILKYDCHILPVLLHRCIRDQQVYVLLDGTAIVGVLRYSLFWQSIPFLDLLYLDEGYRGNGLGKQMMDCWEKEMRAAGFSHVLLSTQEDETAKYFYEKLGYRRIGAFLPPQQDADELMYLKELPTP